MRRRAEQAVFARPLDPAVAPEDEVIAADALASCGDRLGAALNELPAEQRAVIELAYFDGHPYAEVARILGIPEGTAKSRIRIGLARVRAIAGDDLLADR